MTMRCRAAVFTDDARSDSGSVARRRNRRRREMRTWRALTGRLTKSNVYVDPTSCESDVALAYWVRAGLRLQQKQTLAGQATNGD